MTLLAPGEDVVVEGGLLGLGNDGTPKAVYLRPVLEVRLVAELLTVAKKVMV